MLDSNAASNALHTLLKQQTDQRLGHRFETLLSYFFNASERYQILAQNLQIQTQQRTIGEFDFVIKDTQLNQTQHWEVACKFYLGLGNTRKMNNWHGPMLKDRLDSKFKQMQNKQSHLSDHPAAKARLLQQGIRIDQHICLMKGRLFYPLSQTQPQRPALIADNHPHGWWSRPDEFALRFSDPHLHWTALDKKQWFAPRIHSPNNRSYNSKDMLELFLSDPLNRPLCIAGFSALEDSTTETTRGFLVAKDWAKQLAINDNV